MALRMPRLDPERERLSDLMERSFKLNDDMARDRRAAAKRQKGK